MKKVFQTIVFLAIAVAVGFAYINLRARWEVEERLAAINRSIDERIAASAALNARRNEIATKLQQDALKNEADAQTRWDAAKTRGALPANDNTREGPAPGDKRTLVARSPLRSALMPPAMRRSPRR
jgi:hypothetical protein